MEGVITYMARRGGGSFGGGGRSFGGGGSRGFGGRTGGGGGSRGSLGGSSGSSRSSVGGISRSSTSRSSMGPSVRPMGRPSTGAGGCGCLTVPMIIVLIFALIIGIVLFTSLSGDSGSITQSTIERVPLPKGSVVETGYYTDKLDWIQNPTKLTAGMKNFYKETGVQPYLYITETINGSHNPSEEEVKNFAFSLYDNLFTDEAHLLLIFHEYPPGQYSTWYVTGKQAKAVIDSEAVDILLDYIDKYYYYDNLSDEEFFSKTFNDAGERIMNVPKSPWIPVLIILGIGVIVFIGYVWWKKAKDQKNREAAETERMLNTPLDTFGSSEVEELAKKYDDDPPPDDDTFKK